MINDRLVWYLEKNKIITNMQSGFRKQRSTTDQLVRLESFIREAFVQKQHAVAVFFDLEKAYDTTWKCGIMKDLFDAGLRGRLPIPSNCVLIACNNPIQYTHVISHIKTSIYDSFPDVLALHIIPSMGYFRELFAFTLRAEDQQALVYYEYEVPTNGR